MHRYRIVYSSESIEEIRRIVEWYNSTQKGLGDRFRKNLLAEIAAIKQNPLARSFRSEH